MLKETIKYYLFEALLPFTVCLLTLAGFWHSIQIRADGLLIFTGIVFGVVFAWFMIRFRRFLLVALWYRYKCYEFVEKASKMKGVHVRRGGNRTGKSLFGTATAYFKGISTWAYTVRYTLVYQSKKVTERLTGKEYRGWIKLLDTYKFYNEHPEIIPHLVSNVKITEMTGRESMELTCEHLAQLAKLPRYAVVCFDESSNKVDIDLWKDDKADEIFTNFIRFYNHFLGDKALFNFMEQNSERSFKGYRDSVQEITTHKGVEAIFEPIRLQKKLERMFCRFERPAKEKRNGEIIPNKYYTSQYAKRILRLEERIKRIGLLQMSYTTMDNPSVIVADYLALDMPFAYDNEFFCTSYLSREDKLRLSSFAHDVQSEKMVNDVVRIRRVKVEGEKEPRNIAVYRDRPIAELWQDKKQPPLVPP